MFLWGVLDKPTGLDYINHDRIEYFPMILFRVNEIYWSAGVSPI